MVFRVSGAALAALALLSAAPSAAQQPEPPQDAQAPLDPESPLAPLPDLGVDWPDLDADPAEPVSATPQAQTDIASELSYDVRIEGLDGIDAAHIRQRFDELSVLKGEDDEANVAQVDRRAREDAELLGDLLRAEGYYDAFVETNIAPAGAGRLVVTLTAEPGPLYRFADVELPGLAQAGADAPELRESFGVEAKEPVDAAAVLEGQAKLKTNLAESGYPFAEVGEPQVTVDHESRTATLTVDVDPGAPRSFGRILVGEDPLFSARHIQLIARFEPGQPYKASMVDDLRRALIQTGLVSQVRIQPVPGATPETVDLSVELEPAPPRTIAGEAGYGTGEGFRVEGSWQHRNFFPPEGAVTVRAVAGTQEQLLSVALRRNNWRQRDQVLNAQVAVANVERDAYEARTFQLSGGFERLTNILWQKQWTWSLGAELITSDERDSTGTMEERRTFYIGALPTRLSYDGSNDLLDPTEGFRLSGRLSPEISFQSGTFGYARAQIDASGYFPVAGNTVLAGRVRLGSIVGASADRIAPSRRFYAGGGGSVRGYGYQKIGPRDAEDDPTGGRSLAEFSLEARIRIGDFGIVPFIDGGNIYRSEFPDFGGFQYGAGIGVRYHTNFGPIRLDVGTPLNPRPGDARIAVYVSLGQAF